jgi:hypothetical protein|tara:strand:+ start:3973 stop:4581 length:609 start_codon:yes stop_codon:yes gene_type:complete
MGVLTAGHTILCNDRNRRGGIKTIYLGEVANVTGTNPIAPHTYNSIGGITGTGGTGFNVWKFEFDRETAYFTANASRENGSTVVECEVGFNVPKITAAVQARLEELKDTCGLFAILETYADTGVGAPPPTYHFCIGYDEVFSPDAFLEFSSGEQNTGSGLQDPNETVVKLKGFMAEYPREYTGAITIDSAPAIAAALGYTLA